METYRVYFKFPNKDKIYYKLVYVIGNDAEYSWRMSPHNVPHTVFVKAETIAEHKEPSIENAIFY